MTDAAVRVAQEASAPPPASTADVEEIPAFLERSEGVALEQLWERCCEEFLARYESPSTRATYARTLRRFALLALELGAAPMTITPPLLHRFRTTLGEKGLAPATIAKELAVVSSLVLWLGEFVAVPSAGSMRRLLRRPQVKRLPPRVLAVPALEKVLQREDLPDRDRLILQCLAVLGLRAGEIGELQLDDVLSDAAGLPVLRVHGKGHQVREVPLPSDLHQELLAYAERTGRRVGQAEPIFVAEDRARRSRQAAQCHYRRRRRGLSRVAVWSLVRRWIGSESGASPHAMRHTAAVALLEGGADLDAVRAVLGHSTMSVTGRYLERAAPHRARAFLRRSRLLQAVGLPPPDSQSTPSKHP